MTEAPPDDESAGTSNVNVAEADAQVTAQIGVVHGDVTFYTLDGQDGPEGKYRIGRNYLAGNMPREAERLILEAFIAGYVSTEVSYYWSLAILSNRSFDHLTEENFDHLTQAFAAVESDEPDAWSAALGAVYHLIQSLIAQEEQIEPDLEEFDAALLRYAQLPPDRRDEVRRHLEMVLAGAIQDQIEDQDAVEVARKRMGNDRQGRVWKFFEPAPEPPRPLAPPELEPNSQDAGKVVGGAALALACALLGGEYLMGGNPFLFAASLLLFCGGAYLLVRYGLEQRLLVARAGWTEARFTGRVPDETPARPASRRESAFRTGIARLLTIRFHDHVPENGRDASVWNQESAGIRTTLVREIVEQYSAGSGVLPRVGTLDWLARWHADRVFASWKKGELFENRRRFTVPRRTARSSAAGMAMLVLGVLLTAWNTLAVAPFFGPLLTAAWAGATVLVWQGGAAIRQRSAVRTAHEEESHRRLEAEQQAFDNWLVVLGDRPSDAEMATWLDYDKAHVKATAMRHFNLANRDLVAHVILTGPTRFSDRARVVFGPPRYSDYIVQVFLLAENGVRQFSVHLDLGAGAIIGEDRQVFPYDAITSARAKEFCIRMDGERQENVSLEDAYRRRTTSDKLVFSQKFTLTLDNRESIEIVVGNVDEGLLDRMREDPRHFLELTRDTSGVNSAVRILENIAADRGDWVQKERERRRRRILNYQRKRNTVRALESGPTVPAPRNNGVRALPGPHRPFRELPR